jgi:hypothetical protein
VRVDARRLRDKLREYYAFAPHDPLIISVPKGSYAPIFQMNGAIAAPAVDARRVRRPWIVGATFVVITALAWLAVARWCASSELSPARLSYRDVAVRLGSDAQSVS